MASPKFETLVDIFQHRTRTFSSRDLFGEKKNGQWTWMTYAQFGQMVDDLRGGLSQLGVTNGDRVAVISYGKERPECPEAAEQCWSQNRRGVTVASQ